SIPACVLGQQQLRARRRRLFGHQFRFAQRHGQVRLRPARRLRRAELREQGQRRGMQDERQGQRAAQAGTPVKHRGRLKERTMWRHSISTILGLCALALFLHASAPRAQPPDAARYGIRLELGDVAQLRKWLDEGLDPDFVADRIGTGLMIAAWYGNIPMMELLVARGADVNKANALGERALM